MVSKDEPIRFTKSKNTYFAWEEEPKVLAQRMQEKITIWRRWANEAGLMPLWQRKLLNYYGNSYGGNSAQRITQGGSEGELALAKVNDLHALLQEQLVVVTGQRPAGQARAINSDIDSLKSTKIANSLCEYYMTEIGFETGFVNCALMALLCDEGFVDLFWDKSAGEQMMIDPETEEPEMSGDVLMRVHAPWNVARDPGSPVAQQKWHILTFPGNKFDLASKYPDFADDILACGSDDNLGDCPMNYIPDGSDAIWQHLLVHDRTAATPRGLYALMIGDNVVLSTPLPYKNYPVERMCSEEVVTGVTGYSACNDIMGLEEITDALHSVITTNQIMFGGQIIIGPQDCDINVSDLAKGVRFIEVPADYVGLIKPLELCRTPAEIFNYIQVLSQKKERAIGSVQSALAQQASVGASGSSMALIQAQAISFNSGTQRSYFRLLSSTMTKLIGIVAMYSDLPRITQIVGKSKQDGLKAFKYTGEDLSSISSVVYELVNPAAQTFGGRLTMAQDLLKAGQVKSPKQYINLVATGQTEVLTQDDEADGMLILAENEAMAEGRGVMVAITDIHGDHIKSHSSLCTQEARENDPELIERVQMHIQSHLDIMQMASLQNPGVLLLTNQEPLPPVPGMMPPGAPGPGGPPGSGAGAPEGVGQVVGNGEESPAQSIAGGVSQPNLPDIAGTKDKPVIPGATGI